jgi:hypothetical protein
MSPINPHQINEAILRALKLQGQRITKIELTFEVAHLPKLQVTRLVDNADADGLVTAIEVLRLQPVAEPAPAEKP